MAFVTYAAGLRLSCLNRAFMALNVAGVSNLGKPCQKIDRKRPRPLTRRSGSPEVRSAALRGVGVKTRRQRYQATAR